MCICVCVSLCVWGRSTTGQIELPVYSAYSNLWIQIEYKWKDRSWKSIIFQSSCKHLALASPSLSLCPSISQRNFPAVWKSWSIVTAQPGVSPSIPLASHAAQTHKHTCINTCTYTHKSPPQRVIVSGGLVVGGDIKENYYGFCLFPLLYYDEALTRHITALLKFK